MTKNPHIQFYVGDWRKDPAVQSLSYHHRGIWQELLMFMHESEDRGRLVWSGKPMTNSGIARLLGLAERETADAISALLNAGVASRDESGAIICRRMVRENQISQARKESAFKRWCKTDANGNAKPMQTTDIDIDSLNCFKKRFGDLFRRRENTNWNDRELAAFARLNGHVAEDDMVAVERYYRENIPKEKDYRRRDLLTLLNNWNGEVDRAKARLPKPRSAPKPLPQAPVTDPAAEAEFQERLRQWKANGRPLGQFP